MQINGDLQQQLLDLADQCLTRAHDRGATAAELNLGQSEGLSVTVRRGETETVEYNRDKSLALTVYFGHRSGTASTADFSAGALAETVESACNIARYTEEDTFSGLADPEKLATHFPDLDLYHEWGLGMDAALELAAACEQAALQQDARITNSEGGSLSSHLGMSVYANSNHFRGVARSSRHSNSCCVIAEEGGAMQRDYWYDSCRDPAELESPERIGVKAASRTLRRLGARKMKTLACPVVFEAGVAGSLLSHLIAAVSGSNLYRRASFLLDHKGRSIFPGFVRIHEQPRLPKAVNSSSFDAEGVATQNRDIVARGVLQDYVLSSYSARKLGLETTANAGGVRNLTIDSSVEGGLDALLGQMDTGILVTEVIGFGVNTVTGDYSRGAFGFWVENGEIQYPVQEFTIAGNLKDMFQQLAAVGDDVNVHRSIRTGSILVSRMAVAGV